MRKLTDKDIQSQNTSFCTKGKDGKTYKFLVTVVFEDDSGDFAWCIAKPDMVYPKDVDPESSLLFKVTKYKADPTKELVELITDDATMDEIFGVWNTYVDEKNAEQKNKKA